MRWLLKIRHRRQHRRCLWVLTLHPIHQSSTFSPPVNDLRNTTSGSYDGSSGGGFVCWVEHLTPTTFPSLSLSLSLSLSSSSSSSFPSSSLLSPPPPPPSPPPPLKEDKQVIEEKQEIDFERMMPPVQTLKWR